MNKYDKLINEGIILIDDTLSNTYLNNNDNIVKEIRETYISLYHDASNTLNEYLKEFDYQSILSLVHKIKGVSLYIGSNILYELTNDICTQIRENNIKNSYIETLINLNNKIIKILRGIK